MSKKSDDSKSKKEKIKNDLQPKTVEIIKVKENRILTTLRSTYAIIGIVVTILGLTGFFVLRDEIHKRVSTEHELFEEKNITKGQIESPPISAHTVTDTLPNFFYNPKTYQYPLVRGIHIKGLRTRESLSIRIGNHGIGISPKALYGGVFNFFVQMNLYSECMPVELSLAAKDDRLYVSTKFIDLRTENEIGEMEFNHWKIYAGNYLDYSSDDDKFEVKDHQGNIVFSMAFLEQNDKSFVSIAGYFVGVESVLVLTNKDIRAVGDKATVTGPWGFCIKKTDVNWMQNTQSEISKIVSTFKKG